MPTPNSMSIYERCFVYSRTQADDILKVETKNNIPTARKKFKLGRVVVNGVQKDYTEIVTSMDRARYPDAILVAKGDIRNMKFTEPTF